MVNPPRIRIEGNKERGCHLRKFALEQLEMLKNQMGYQGLFQGVKTYKNDSGEIVSVRRIGAIDDVFIFSPLINVPQQEKETWKVECWCKCCFAEGEIIECSDPETVSDLAKQDAIRAKYGEHASFGDWGQYTTEGDGLDDPYPTICTAADIDIKNYNGIRYLVQVCQTGTMEAEVPLQKNQLFKRFTVVASDFAEYWPGDRVILMFWGNWRGEIFENGTCFDCKVCRGACSAQRRPREKGEYGPDGNFVILPLRVKGINSSLPGLFL